MIDFLKHLLFVPKCLHCGEVLAGGEEVLCAKCRLEWDKLLRVPCKTCGRAQKDCRCLPPRLWGEGLLGVHLFLFDDALSRKLIYAVKHRLGKDLCRFLAKPLARSVREAAGDLSNFTVTFAPRKPKSIREFGFDQAALLAEALAAELSLPMTALFCHARLSDLQKNLDSEERAKNAEKSYSLLKNACAETQGLIIVDDVMTTGSTLSRLATLAREAGYEEIIVVTLAKTPTKKEKSCQKEA